MGATASGKSGERDSRRIIQKVVVGPLDVTTLDQTVSSLLKP
jgi:hypothetical protein